MDTLHKIVSEETQNYVGTLAKGDDDWLRIEDELMKRIRVRITQTNQLMAKGDSRLQMPKYLEFGQIAEILNATMTIKVLVDDDNEDTQILGIFDGEIYSTDQKILAKAAIAMNNTLKSKDINDVIDRLMLICERKEINKDRDLIAVGNGIFDYKKKVLLPFSEDLVFLSKSIVDYDPSATLKTFPDGWNVEDWLKEISVDNEVCQLLWETIGAVLRPYVSWDKTVWLYSTTGNNGKGTFCELLRNMLGSNAYASIPVADFAKEFGLTPIIGAQAIITDENDVGLFIDKVANMKAVVTGDIVTVNRKFKDPVNYRFHGMMVQCLNEYPRIKDKSDSFYRRQILVPFDKCFTGRANKDIKGKYLKDDDVLRYVLKKLLMTNYYELSEPAVCTSTLADYKETNDPIRQYWNEFEDEFQWDLLPNKFLFDLYISWYNKNFPRGSQVSSKAFMNSLRVIVQRESTKWACDDDSKKRHRIKDMMSKPEPLITKYDLTDWMSKSYQGRELKKKATLKPDELAASYAGLLRRKNGVCGDDDDIEIEINVEPETNTAKDKTTKPNNADNGKETTE